MFEDRREEERESVSEKERERERTEEEVEEGEDDNKETKEQIKSTPALLTLTYRTTEPRMNTFFTVASCWSFCGFCGWGVSKDGALAEEGRRERRGKKKTCLRVPLGLADPDLCQLDVQVLVDAVEHSGDGQVVLKLDRDLFAHEGLEEGVEDHSFAL